MMGEKMNSPTRQGDIVFWPVSEVPSDAVRIGQVVQDGAHQHTADAACECYRASDGIYLRSATEIEVSHAEHRTVALAAGVHVALRKRQYDRETGLWAPVED